MPAVSEKQERLMQGVAHDPAFAKKVGIPQSVGKEFVDDDDDETNRFIEKLALILGSLEERGVIGDDFEESKHHRAANGEFGSGGSSEHSKYVQSILASEDVGAFLKDAPMGFKVKLAMALAAMGGSAVKGALRAHDCFAMDRASVRSFDEDGRLHVEKTNISKANVCEYMGREVPEWESLGLDPDKLYRLYRDPDELAKAAPSFNGVPLLERHEPVSADDHPRDLVIGAVGNDAKFEHPYLTNSLVVWPGDVIERIKNKEASQLSAGYYYRADMTPGVSPDGEKFDGVMRDITANHVAIVPEGRAGSDVCVGDSKKGIDMAKRTRAASPIAQAKALVAKMKKGMANDADIGALAKLIDAFGEAPTEGKDALTENGGEPASAVTYSTEPNEGGIEPHAAATDPGSLEQPEEGMDDDPFAEIRKFLTGKLSDEDLAKLDELIAAAVKPEDKPVEAEAEKPLVEAGAETPEAPKEDLTGDEEDEEKKDDKDMVTKPAMDAAIAEAVAAERRRQNDIRAAEEAVRPVVGKLVGMDSAEGVYRAAFKSMGRDVSKVHASALPILFKEIAAVTKKAPQPETRVAMDTAQVSEYQKMFPDAARIRHV